MIYTSQKKQTTQLTEHVDFQRDLIKKSMWKIEGWLCNKYMKGINAFAQFKISMVRDKIAPMDKGVNRF